MTTFYSDIPMWTLLIWAIVVVVISIYFYKRKGWIKDISRLRRVLLISLRSLGLFFLGLLLLGILIRGLDTTVKKPLVITIIDDSKSMLNYADSSTVKSTIKQLIQAEKIAFKSQYNTLFFTLDDQFQNSDSVSFINKKTNLGKSLNKIYNTYYGRNIGAIVLVSDGNYNTGITPTVSAHKFKRTPIYTLGVGDTIQKVDHLVKAVLTNDVAFLGNKFPVEVTIEGNRTPNQKFDIQLYQNGKVIARKTLKHQDNMYSIVKTKFLVDAKHVGIYEYKVKIQALSDEYNTNNNEKSFYVEILDDRSKILLVWESLNPDVGAINSLLSVQNNLEVKVVGIKHLPESLEPYDLLIWHNPGVAHQASAFQKLSQSKLPKWYFITPQTPVNAINKLKLNAQIQKSQQSDDINAAFNQSFNLFQLPAETRKALDNFPPFKVPFGKVEYNQTNSILAYQSLGRITKRDPLFFFGKDRQLKYAVIYGTGIWRWLIADYKKHKNHNAIKEIVNKTVEYLVLKENTSRLRINLPSIANDDKDFTIRATFYNASYEPITTPTIDFHLKKQDGTTMEYAFLPVGKGYVLNLGKLSPGRYEWKASTTFNDKSYQKQGTFAVQQSQLEKLSTKANHQVLAQIAQNSNGQFMPLNKYDKVIKSIQNRDDIAPIEYSSSSYHKLLDYWWLLLLIVILFISEWVLRRYSGGY